MIHNEFQCINEQAWIRLITAVYFAKFKKFFHSKSVAKIFDLIMNHPDSSEVKRMVSALNYASPSSTTVTWHEFIRRVAYHVPKVTKYHEHKLLPSYQALVLHCSRALPSNSP